MVYTVRRCLSWSGTLWLAIACGPTTSVPTTDSGGGSSSTSTTTSAGPTSFTTGSADSTSGEAEPPSNFVAPDDVEAGDECSVTAQDCPAGTKCNVWSGPEGSQWDAWGCFPLDEDPDGIGEPCTAEGFGQSGVDSCAMGSMCFFVDPETGEGTCFAFCQGDPFDSSELNCEDPDTSCSGWDTVTLHLCLPKCDPLGDDCDEGQSCYSADGTNFRCGPDSSGEMGAVLDPCDFVTECDPGNYCASGELVPGCGAFMCCSSLCSLSDPAPPCLAGQECIPWFDPEWVLPGYEDLGACTNGA